MTELSDDRFGLELKSKLKVGVKKIMTYPAPSKVTPKPRSTTISASTEFLAGTPHHIRSMTRTMFYRCDPSSRLIGWTFPAAVATGALRTTCSRSASCQNRPITSRAGEPVLTALRNSWAIPAVST